MTNRESVRRARACGWVLWMVGGLVCALGAAAPARAADYLRTPTPGWVERQVLDQQAQPPSGQALDGVHYVLVDQQTQLEPRKLVSYRRFASKVLNARGAETAAHISIDFDPAYQRLALHTLHLYRDGVVQDRLATAQIKVLQRETELEYRIYDGSKTVDVVLQDVRPGDIVEYAYSVAGSNPVLAGLEFGRMDMQWRVPVEHLHRRLRFPSDMAVHVRPMAGAAPAQISSKAGWTEHVWRASQVAPAPSQRDVPGWYEPFAVVRWSMFDDWAAVAQWAQPLYAVPGRPGAALQKEIDRIAKEQLSAPHRLLAVLDFVQSQIRYLGIEMGQGSYRPRPPEAVLANRFGDCKDKVLLAVTMLRALGVEAYPALVHTKRRQTIADTLPSPGAFNHVILKAHVDGKDYWLDPTKSPQKGRIDQIAQANFGQALVLDGAARALSAMPVDPTSWHRRQISMAMDVSKGYELPASLQIVSTYTGAAADNMRQTLRSENLEDLQRSYLNFYLRYYPGLRNVKPFTFEDDEGGNSLVLQEYYERPPFLPPSDKKKPELWFSVPDMVSLLDTPDDRVRTAPYTLRHPEEVTVSLSVHLPQTLSLKPQRVEIKDKAFEFVGQRDGTQSESLLLTYRYRSLADHVNPADVEAYMSNLDKSRDQVGYLLRNPGSHGSSSVREAVGVVSLLLAMVTGLCAFGAGVGVMWGLRQRKAREDVRWETRRLLWTGGMLFWLPWLSALGVVFASVMFAERNTVWNAMYVLWPLAVLCIYLWFVVWRGPWFRCLARLAQDPVAVSQKARRLGLPADAPKNAQSKPDAVA